MTASRHRLFSIPLNAAVTLCLLLLVIQLKLNIAILSKLGQGTTSFARNNIEPQDAAELPIGAPVPNEELLTRERASVGLLDAVAMADTNLLIFIDARCKACHDLVARLRGFSKFAEGFQVLLLARSVALSAEDLPEKVESFIYSGSSLAVALGAAKTPAGVIVSKDGIKLSAALRGFESVQNILQHYTDGISEARYVS